MHTPHQSEQSIQEYKQEFSRKCTREFTENGMSMIKGLREWLLERINN